MLTVLWMFSLIQGVLLGLGLQHKTVEDLEKDVDLPSSQLLGLFNKMIRKIVTCLNQVLETEVEQGMIARQEIQLQPMEQSMDDMLVCLLCLH